MEPGEWFDKGMELDYHVVDVFTDRPYAGNPLAVVLGADGLDTGRMAAIAREFNLSETVFVLAPGGAGDYRVRIFTPAVELPFAGHPSVGVAATLVRAGLLTPGERVQECGAGDIPVRATANEATVQGGRPAIGPKADPEPLLAAAGLTEADLADPENLPARRAAAGIEHVFLPVKPEAVGRAALDGAAARERGVGKVYVFAWDPERRTAHARLFDPEMGIAEDPATGSAALALGVWLGSADLLPEGRTEYTVQQGAELGRPSTMHCTVTVADGAVTGTTVTGEVVPVASGRITAP